MPERGRDRGRFAVGVGEVGEDADKLHRLRERDPELDRLTGHVRKFAVMTAGRHGDRLDDWIADAEQDTPAPRASFARNLRRDLDAVRNGLSLPYSSSAVEGNINRLMLKRQIAISRFRDSGVRDRGPGRVVAGGWRFRGAGPLSWM
ncbi:hypothetical protein DKG34_39575 [Streptomyces sp. NWU49]|uniref:hypothetical protein n=1 Tax=Streptomyces sp. NWU49 TaxID=2201153 RepID=UPI000D67E1E7|nr:hypothetical protein [Streptomyces sp. NWU49]PWJ02272.1 hypothetical protein DKG34_39575 [Streptomyces sp. NWU49]